MVEKALAARIVLGSATILNDSNFKEVFAPKGSLLKEGDMIYRKLYAKTLQSIADEGPDVFYNGWIAKEILKTVNSTGGIITQDDLNYYQAQVREPVTINYRGRTIISAPPPTSGPVLLSSFGTLGHYKLFEESNIDLHRMVESFKFGYAERSLLGDPIDSIYTNISKIVNEIFKDNTTFNIYSKITNETHEPSFYNPSFDVLNDHGTMHLSILSGDGDAVSLTSTVNLLFGSKVMVSGTGIILNDQMDDFSIPGVSNAFGLAPSPYNYIQPRKRPLSSAVPTFVEEKGRVVGVCGASGGSHIITATVQTLIAMFDWNLHPDEAVHHPRLHHQLLPNKVLIEQNYSVEAEAFLKARGHFVERMLPGVTYSGVAAIRKTDDGWIQAAGDRRKGGVAVAF